MPSFFAFWSFSVVLSHTHTHTHTLSHTHIYIYIQYIYIYIYIYCFCPHRTLANPVTLHRRKCNADADLFFRHRLPRHPCFFYLLIAKPGVTLGKDSTQYQFRNLQWTCYCQRHSQCTPTVALPRQDQGVQMKGTSFPLSGYCTFAECPVCVEVTVTDECTLKAAVTFQGDEVCHSLEELKRRPVRADERHNFAEQLESILPRALHLQKINHGTAGKKLAGILMKF